MLERSSNFTRIVVNQTTYNNFPLFLDIRMCHSVFKIFIGFHKEVNDTNKSNKNNYGWMNGLMN